jgi:GT2 family glycosyltransferase
VLLLNPDTEILGDSLAQMLTYLDQNPEVGILGPHTLNTDGSTQSSASAVTLIPVSKMIAAMTLINVLIFTSVLP